MFQEAEIHEELFVFESTSVIGRKMFEGADREEQRYLKMVSVGYCGSAV